jgi:starch synthase
LKILHTTAEFFPYIKSGGLSDMLSSLSVAQSASHSVYIALPKIASIQEKIFYTGNIYQCISEDAAPYSDASIILKKSIFREAEWSGIKIYFFESPIFEKLQSIYANANEHYNFAIFSYACYHLSRVLDVDIVHSHDWHTALTTVLCKLYSKRKTCFTIHNLAYQGDHPFDICGFLRADPFYMVLDSLIHIDKINYMKSAIEVSDEITTVSPGYRDEVLEEPTGFFLSWLLRERKSSFTGILNGINEKEWNPETDEKIYTHYNFETCMEGKRENKFSLYEEFGLDVNIERPLIGIVSRLSFQKGFKTFLNSFKLKANLPFYFFILGTGDKDLEDSFFYESHHSKDRLFFFKGFNETIARKIEAASDFFLMPSLFEPCGLNQLYSQVYGSIPIVSRVGGLKDSVTENKTGFVFEAGLEHSLNYALERALSLYQNPDEFYATRTRIMQIDWSWKKGIEAFDNTYKKALGINI